MGKRSNNFQQGGGGASRMGKAGGRSKGAMERRNAGRNERFRAKKMGKAEARAGKRMKKERAGEGQGFVSEAATALLVTLSQVIIGVTLCLLAFLAVRYVLSD